MGQAIIRDQPVPHNISLEVFAIVLIKLLHSKVPANLSTLLNGEEADHILLITWWHRYHSPGV
jgi:hypothetical protein